MRLHTLSITAFGPYASPQTIDFARLTGSGLFLLEGPTGAGKTTILDAITYALYGGLAGEESAEDRLRSHFAGPEAEPCAELEFSVCGVRYRITRTPEHRRPKRRGEGFTLQKAQVHLQRMDAGGWQSVSHNKAEVGDLVIEAVGLNRAQFTQVMLLPQGEFARFLRCGDDDRRDLLTKLFGTGLYDRITAELDRRRAAAVRERERSAAAIDHAVSAAAEAAGLDTQARAALVAMGAAERGVALKETGDTLAAAWSEADAELASAEAALKVAASGDEEAQRLAARMGRLTSALAELQAHETARPGHEERTARLDAARRAAPVRPLLEALGEAKAATDAARDDIAAAAVDVGSGQDAAALAAQAAGRAVESERAAAALEHLVAREANLPELADALAGAMEAADRASARVAALHEDCRDLPGLVSQLEGELQQARLVAGGLAAGEDLLEHLDAQHGAAVRAAELGPLADAARAAKEAAVDAHQARRDQYQELNDARLTGIAAELALRLSDGQPCPVCGATHHPTRAPAHEGMVSAGDVAEAARLVEEAEGERARCESEYQQLITETAACEAASGGRAPGDLAAEVAEVTRSVAQARQAAEETAGLAGALSAARARQEASAQDLREAELQAVAAEQRVTAARGELAGLAEELAAAAQGHESAAQRQQALRESAAADQALEKALGRLATALAAEAAAHDRAMAEAAGLGFADLAEARAAVLDRDTQAALEAEVSSWAAALATLAAAARAEDLAGLDPSGAEAASEAARSAAGALGLAQVARRQAQRARDAADDRAARFAGRLEEVREAESGYEDLVARTEAVIRLAGLAKGTEGHRRVSLTTYVLRHWFAQVVAAANVRLSAMSSGRYELKRTDEGEHRRERAGLTLAVIDRHTGEERSPASLSGGETFYTSLALALGLADVVRAEAGGMELDTLFIDEGFGSLDAETLDQVMAVVDDLRDRGRVIGIVSHVADLKERVPERLEVRRLPDGSSATRVVA